MLPHVLVIGVPSSALPSWSWPSSTPRPHCRAHVGASSEEEEERRPSRGRPCPPRDSALLLLFLVGVVAVILAAMAISLRPTLTPPAPPTPATTAAKQRGTRNATPFREGARGARRRSRRVPATRSAPTFPSRWEGGTRDRSRWSTSSRR